MTTTTIWYISCVLSTKALQHTFRSTSTSLSLCVRPTAAAPAKQRGGSAVLCGTMLTGFDEGAQKQGRDMLLNADAKNPRCNSWKETEKKINTKAYYK